MNLTIEDLEKLEARVTQLEIGLRPFAPMKERRRKPKVTGPFDTRQELCDEVNRLLKVGVTGRRIADYLNISEPTVSRIKHGDLKAEVDGFPKASLAWRNET